MRRADYLLIYSKRVARTKAFFHPTKVTWHPIQHLLPDEVFHLRQSQGNLSLQVCACATQHHYHALVEAPAFKSLVHLYLLLSMSVFHRSSHAALPRVIIHKASPVQCREPQIQKGEQKTRSKFKFTLCDPGTLMARLAATTQSQEGTWYVNLLFPWCQSRFWTILAFFYILLQHRISTSKLRKWKSFTTALLCTKNVQWYALGEKDKMVIDVLGDRVNWVTVMWVGGNTSVQYIPKTLTKTVVSRSYEISLGRENYFLDIW